MHSQVEMLSGETKFYADLMNLKCANISKQLRKPITSLPTEDVKAAAPSVSLAVIDSTAEMFLMAEKAMNKAKENLSAGSTRKPLSSAWKMKNKTIPEKGIKEKNSRISHTIKGPAANASKSLPTSTSAMPKVKVLKPAPLPESDIAKVKKEIQSLVKNVDIDLPKPDKAQSVKKPDPCLLTRISSNGKHSSQMDSFSRLFEDCWMLRNNVHERDFARKMKSQFCSKLTSSIASEAESKQSIIELLQMSRVVSYLRGSIFFSAAHMDLEFSLQRLPFLPVSDALLILCVFRKLLHLHNQLKLLPFVADLNKSAPITKTIKMHRIDSLPINSTWWIPKTLSINPIDEYLSSKYLHAVPSSGILPTEIQILLVKRALISLWPRWLACDETQIWSAISLRGIHNLLCSSRLAPPLVILEAD